MDGFGVGIDIEATRRFHNTKRSLFTSDEWDHAAGRTDSLAGIWCAKEAVVKAIAKWRVLGLRDVEVGWEHGRPVVQIPGFEVELSISHTDETAVAVAIARPT